MYHPSTLHPTSCAGRVFFFFFITLKPRVEWYTKSMSLRYEPGTAAELSDLVRLEVIERFWGV